MHTDYMTVDNIRVSLCRVSQAVFQRMCTLNIACINLHEYTCKYYAVQIKSTEHKPHQFDLMLS